MFKTLHLENFRSFAKLDLKFAPITIFVGPNNSGKSSAISALRLLTQTLESNDPNVRLLLNGPFGDFGTYKDLVHGNQIKKVMKIAFELALEKGDEYYGGSSDTIKIDLKYKYRSSLKEVVLKEFKQFGNSRHLFTAEYVDDSERFIARTIAKTKLPAAQASSASKGFDVRNFLPRMLGVGLRNSSAHAKLIGDDEEKVLRELIRNSWAVSNHFQRSEYVGAMRQPPARTFLYAGERRRRVGASGEFAVAILAMDSMRRGGKARGIRQNVISWLTASGIASDLRIVPLSDRYYEIHIQHPVTKEYENFADVGYGNSQVIPVLVAGYNLSKGDTFLVEEPEIHLHPRAQAELGDFFVDLRERGVQSIVETHSEHMIIRLQQHVASGRIGSDDVCVYYIDPTPEGKMAIRLGLDDRGVFTMDWPGGFFPERLEEATRLARHRARIPSPSAGQSVKGSAQK